MSDTNDPNDLWDTDHLEEELQTAYGRLKQSDQKAVVLSFDIFFLTIWEAKSADPDSQYQFHIALRNDYAKQIKEENIARHIQELYVFCAKIATITKGYVKCNFTPFGNYSRIITPENTADDSAEIAQCIADARRQAITRGLFDEKGRPHVQQILAEAYLESRMSRHQPQDW